MAVYEVKSPDGKVSLVECRTSAAAIAHVATKGYTATAMRKTMDVVRRVQAGEVVEMLVEKETAITEPAPILEHIEAAEADKPSENSGESQEQNEQPRKGGRFLSRKSA